MQITITTNDDGVITGWAEVGGLEGGVQIDVADAPNDLANGYYRLTSGQIQRDDELYRVYRSKQVPCPPHLCKPYYDLDLGWIETATPEELAEWQPPETPSQKIANLETENALLALELATTQLRLEQAEQEQAALLLELVDKGVL
jgi:hypothetical protein